MRRTSALLVGLLALVCAVGRAGAQESDVELLGQIYGTRPPDAYFELKARRANAFEMTRGMAAGRGMPASGLRSGARLRAAGDVASITLGTGRVRGTFRFPVVLGLFADSPPSPFSPAQVQAHFFDGPNPTGTISDLYREMSNNAVTLVGEVRPWGRSALAQDSVTRESSGLGSSARVGEFIMELLAQQPPGTDWGRYDNDGPDGIANSGDDDGFVDILAVIHPTAGAECGGDGRADRVWSHKWTLRSSVGQDYVTGTPTPSGGRIRVDDYTIQPVRACGGETLNEIGVFAHELGHGFGLPDLYAETHSGAGRWDLMGTGSWGCSSTFEPERPCHMGAWSKSMLGWLDVDVLPFGSGETAVTLEPVERSARALAIPAGDGSGEYFLLENRQRIGFDAAVPASGLLVWHVDPWTIAGRLAGNEVNASATRMGVWLRQADGLEQLGATTSQRGNRGDEGDPFPGSTANTVFHAGSTPRSFTHTRTVFEQQTRALPASAATGVTLTEIRESGDRVTFRARTGYRTVRIRSAGDAGGSSGLFKVDGLQVSAVEAVIRSAPYQRHTIEAAVGSALGEGVRRGFSGWEDEPDADRVRSWTTGLEDVDLVAIYGGPREVRFRLTLDGARFDVAPGRIVTVPASPDLWFDEGTHVSFRAEPTGGFAFRDWAGDLSGQPNPALLLMDQPRDATARFELVFGLDPDARVTFPAGAQQQITLQARNANAPVIWSRVSGALPDGIKLDGPGVLFGEATETGAFRLELFVRDALGLEARGSVTLEVTVPVLGIASLIAPFVERPGSLSAGQQAYLDRAGNRSGAYDLGDLRAYVLANPDAPPVTPAPAAALRLLELVDFGARDGR